MNKRRTSLYLPLSAVHFLVVVLVHLFVAPAIASAETRVALVIGNASYEGAPLKNPVNDARSMGRVLDGLGFEVIVVEDASRDAMVKSVQEFVGRLTPESVGLFYYAGHGIQARGRNYLIPVGAALESESALRFETVSVSAVLEEMELAQNRVNLVILDACRNNPFERRFRGGSRGLAAIDAARGSSSLTSSLRVERKLMISGPALSPERCRILVPFVTSRPTWE